MPAYRPVTPGLQRVDARRRPSRYLLRRHGVPRAERPRRRRRRHAVVHRPPALPAAAGAVGRVHTMTPDGTTRVVADGFHYCNGIALEPDGTPVVVESDGSACASLPDGDDASGSSSSSAPATGDGFCVDVDGRFYVAVTDRPRDPGVRARRHRGRLPRDPGPGPHHQLLLRRRRPAHPVRHRRHPGPARRLGGHAHARAAPAPVAVTPRAGWRGSVSPSPSLAVRPASNERGEPRCAPRSSPRTTARSASRTSRPPIPARATSSSSITASGICHSDLSVINGTLPMPPPAILGHEGAGVVDGVGAEVTRAQGGRPGHRLVHPRVRHLLVLPARPVEPLREHLHRDDATRAPPAATARRSPR